MCSSDLGAALEFATYRSSMDLPDPEKLLDGQIQWAHDKQRLDVSYAVFSTCSALVVISFDPRCKRLTTSFRLSTMRCKAMPS